MTRTLTGENGNVIKLEYVKLRAQGEMEGSTKALFFFSSYFVDNQLILCKRNGK